MEVTPGMFIKNGGRKVQVAVAPDGGVMRDWRNKIAVRNVVTGRLSMIPERRLQFLIHKEERDAAREATKQNKALPALVKRTGQRQLSISLGEAQASELERMRIESGLRSWNQVIRMLIADAMVRRHKALGSGNQATKEPAS